MKGPKIGLALGSGAAKGIAHIGVLKCFEEEGVPIHAVSGSSAGAIAGGAYAAGVSIEKMTEFCKELASRHIVAWADPAFLFRGGGLIKGDKLEKALGELLGVTDFKDLKIPFYAIATDLITGNEVVLKSGDLLAAIHASYSVPGIFSPPRYNGRILVDGGVVAPVPTRVLKEAGCDIIIGVHVATSARTESSLDNDGSPGIFDVLLQVLSVGQQKIALSCMELAAVNIIPDTADCGWTDFSKTDEMVEKGYLAAKHYAPIIKGMAASSRGLSFFRRIFGR